MKALHQKKKPMSPRVTDAMPPISNNIAEPPYYLMFFFLTQKRGSGKVKVGLPGTRKCLINERS
jgi:hypothetical protein